MQLLKKLLVIGGLTVASYNAMAYECYYLLQQCLTMGNSANTRALCVDYWGNDLTTYEVEDCATMCGQVYNTKSFNLTSLNYDLCDDVCSSGYYYDTETHLCRPCVAGSYLGYGWHFYTACQACPSGKYSNSGAGGCSNCAPGTYSSSEGSSTCAKCEPGTYTNESGATYCETCDDGYYQDESGATSCKTCPEYDINGDDASVASIYGERTSKNSCYKKEGYVDSDETGSYIWTSDCFYTN